MKSISNSFNELFLPHPLCQIYLTAQDESKDVNLQVTPTGVDLYCHVLSCDQLVIFLFS